VSIRFTYLIQDSLLNSLSELDLQTETNENDFSLSFSELSIGSIQDSIE
jgi:hypothetical protein